jgi:hypothetical protein
VIDTETQMGGRYPLPGASLRHFLNLLRGLPVCQFGGLRLLSHSGAIVRRYFCGGAVPHRPQMRRDDLVGIRTRGNGSDCDRPH